MNVSIRSTLALALLLACAAGAQDRPLLLQNGVAHLGSDTPLRGCSILIEGRTIQAVGPAIQAPPGAQVIDLQGQHVYPGLIDADTVLGLSEIDSISGPRDTQEVGEINPNLRAELAVNPDSELLPVARTGGVLLACVGARSGLINGTSAVIYTDGWTWEDMTVRAPASLLMRWPNMRIDRSGEHADPVEKQLEDRGAKLRQLEEAIANAAAYWRAREALDAERMPGDVKWDALRAVVDVGETGYARPRLPVAVHADRLDQIRAALDFAQRHKLKLILVGAGDAWRIADELAERNVPVILGPVQSLPRRAWAGLDVAYENAGKLHAAGVKLAFSTGPSTFTVSNVRNLRLQAAQAVAHGLPVVAAERALTVGAAEILGVAERVGSLQEGKEATLFVASGDILETPTRVTRAWIAGRDVSLRDRQQRLYDRYRGRPR